MGAKERLEKMKRDEELRDKLESSLVLPDFAEWEEQWTEWMEALISTENLFVIGDDGGVQRLTPDNITDAVKKHKSILDWTTTGELRESGAYWLTCQECLSRSSKNEFEKWIWEHYKNLFEEYGYSIMEDAMDFFANGYYRVWHIYVYGLLFDYSAEAFLAVYTKKILLKAHFERWKR